MKYWFCTEGKCNFEKWQFNLKCQAESNIFENVVQGRNLGKMFVAVNQNSEGECNRTDPSPLCEANLLGRQMTV